MSAEARHVVVIQRDPRIRAVYLDTLDRWSPLPVATPAELDVLVDNARWDAVLVSSPIGRRGTWAVVEHLLATRPRAVGRLVVVAAGDPPPGAPAVLHLQPFCTREDLQKGVVRALDGDAAPLPGRQVHKLRWVVPETYDQAVHRAAEDT